MSIPYDSYGNPIFPDEPTFPRPEPDPQVWPTRVAFREVWEKTWEVFSWNVGRILSAVLIYILWTSLFTSAFNIMVPRVVTSVSANNFSYSWSDGKNWRGSSGPLDQYNGPPVGSTPRQWTAEDGTEFISNRWKEGKTTHTYSGPLEFYTGPGWRWTEDDGKEYIANAWEDAFGKHHYLGPLQDYPGPPVAETKENAEPKSWKFQKTWNVGGADFKIWSFGQNETPADREIFSTNDAFREPILSLISLWFTMGLLRYLTWTSYRPDRDLWTLLKNGGFYIQSAVYSLVIYLLFLPMGYLGTLLGDGLLAVEAPMWGLIVFAVAFSLLVLFLHLFFLAGYWLLADRRAKLPEALKTSVLMTWQNLPAVLLSLLWFFLLTALLFLAFLPAFFLQEAAILYTIVIIFPIFVVLFAYAATYYVVFCMIASGDYPAIKHREYWQNL